MLKPVRIPVDSDKFDYIELRGGLDLLTPTLKLKAGYVRDALNWEQSITGGYTRIAGYERFDGRPSPSQAQYFVLTVTLNDVVPVGSTIVGGTTGATGVVISLTENLIAYTKATGAFAIGETVSITGTPRAIVTDLGGVGQTPSWDAQQLASAANVYRGAISAVPGSGPVLGVAEINGVKYAWRNTVSATSMAIFKATPSGWTGVPLGFEIKFTGGNTAYTEGSTLVQGGVSATVLRVAVEGGSWGSGNASGRLIFASATGAFAAGAAAGSVGVATLSGPATAITLLPNGRIQTDFGNFGGGPRLYGCDGVNRGFEFDGTTYVPINSGQTIDKPTQVLVHKGHLFFAFGTNLQNSSIATLTNLYPQYNWQVTNGAVQYALEGEITALLRQPGDQSTGAMSVSLDGGTKMLYGSSAADFRIVPFEESGGAKSFSAQRLGGQSLVFSNTGVFSLSATQAFGNFTPASMTLNIRPFTQMRRNLCTGSLVNREKSQYRLFFSDGYGLYMTVVNGKLMGSMPVSFPNKVTCTSQGELQDGAEASFFGADNGFVYQLDAGTSFDGLPIDSYMTLTFANQGNSQVLKNYRSASFEIQGDGYATFDMTYEIGYASADLVQQSGAMFVSTSLSAVYWDMFTWDAFTWDGRTLAPSNVPMDGTAENVALRIDSTSDLFKPFTINSVVLRYKQRRSLRGENT